MSDYIQQTPHPMNVGRPPKVWFGIKSLNDFVLNTAPDPDTVSLIKDKSGNGNDGIPPSGSAQPEIATEANGKNVLDMDGLANEFKSFTHTYGSDTTWFLVAEETAVGGIANDYIVGGSGGAASPAFITGFNNGGRQDYEFFLSGGYRLILKTVASAGLHIVAITHRDESSFGANDGVGTGYFDGAQVATANPGSAIVSGLSLTALGSNGVGGDFYQGRLAEFLIYDRILPLPSIDRIHRYLANQWNITI